MFWKVEQNKKNPLIDFSLFSSMPFNAATISNFSLNLMTSIVGFSIMFYLQDGRGLPAFQAGLTTVGYLTTLIFFIRIGEKLMSKFNSMYLMAAGSSIAAVPLLILMFTSASNITYTVLCFLALAVIGVGNGVYATPSTVTAVSASAEEKAAVASGIYKMSSALGSSVGITIAGAIQTSILKATNNINMSMKTLIVVACITGLLGAVAAILCKNSSKKALPNRISL
ncbi:MFS transporter [Lactococcus sp. DD01]|uniref:MFS transporter n=1 Tax=Lactococcus sp. DD01 TaxID=1776443 RepID=UPI00077630A9|nr:MFS transporter [Lactococcus sp. DD01]KXT59463.1 major facilitator superfamily MFS_1 transporter [Lactococcus sp. DD01]